MHKQVTVSAITGTGWRQLYRAQTDGGPVPSGDGQASPIGTLRMAWAWLHKLNTEHEDLEERVAYLEDKTGIRLHEDDGRPKPVEGNPATPPA